MVGSIAATDFSSVAGLGALLTPPVASTCRRLLPPLHAPRLLLHSECSSVVALACLRNAHSCPSPAACLSADAVVRQLREMVLLPMQYPELFEGMGLQPPR